MEAGDVIKHKRFMDVAIMVYEVKFAAQHAVIKSGVWLSQGSGTDGTSFRLCSINETGVPPFELKISYEDLQNWEKLAESSEIKKLRSARWVPVLG
jgi:hypothetical protein